MLFQLRIKREAVDKLKNKNDFYNIQTIAYFQQHADMKVKKKPFNR